MGVVLGNCPFVPNCINIRTITSIDVVTAYFPNFPE